MAYAVCCASAVATIQAMREEDVLANATLRGRQLMDGIVRISDGGGTGGANALGARFPFKVDTTNVFVRGSSRCSTFAPSVCSLRSPHQTRTRMNAVSSPSLFALYVRRCPPTFKDLRGLGLMVGLEFEVPQGSGAAMAVTQACLKRGMILLVCSSYETVRFIPPLNVSEAEMEEGLGIFEGAVKEVFG